MNAVCQQIQKQRDDGNHLRECHVADQQYMDWQGSYYQSSFVSLFNKYQTVIKKSLITKNTKITRDKGMFGIGNNFIKKLQIYLEIHHPSKGKDVFILTDEIVLLCLEKKVTQK